MDLFDVNKKTCNRDGICAAVCPTGVIAIEKDDYPAPTSDAEEVCIRCGHCVAVCPTASFSHREMLVENCPPIQKELKLSPEQCEQFLRGRRSIRTYKEKEVPKNELSKLINLARFAPTGHNSQSVEWLVLANRDDLTHLTGIIVDWLRWMTENVPEIAESLHMERTIQRCEEGKDIILRGAPVVVVAHGSKDDLMVPTSSTIARMFESMKSADQSIVSDKVMTKAYGWFVKCHPQPTIDLLSKQFLAGAGKPVIDDYVNGKLNRRNAAVVLAETREEELDPARSPIRKQRKADLVLAADSFLKILCTELA